MTNVSYSEAHYSSMSRLDVVSSVTLSVQLSRTSTADLETCSTVSKRAFSGETTTSRAASVFECTKGPASTAGRSHSGVPFVLGRLFSAAFTNALTFLYRPVKLRNEILKLLYDGAVHIDHRKPELRQYSLSRPLLTLIEPRHSRSSPRYRTRTSDLYCNIERDVQECCSSGGGES